MNSVNNGKLRDSFNPLKLFKVVVFEFAYKSLMIRDHSTSIDLEIAFEIEIARHS